MTEIELLNYLKIINRI